MSYFQPKLGYQEYYLVKEQQNMGHTVKVITSDRFQYNKSFSRLFGSVLKNRIVGVGEFEEEGIEVTRLPCLLEFHDQIFLRTLEKKLSEFNPDIICVHDEISQVAFLSIVYKILHKRHLIMDVHADYGNMSNDGIRRLIFQLLSRNPIYRLLYKKSDMIIAISEDSKMWLSNEMATTNNVKVVPLAAETSHFYQNRKKRERMRKKLELNDSIVIIYAGKILREKKIDLLIKAAAYLKEKELDIKVIIVGNGPEDCELELHSLVKKLSVGDIVTFKSYVDKKELPDFYNAADIGVWPGAASITIIEAMAVGLPIVIPLMSNTSHLFEYDVGFHFPPGNILALEKHLESLVLNKNLRENKGLQAQRMVADKLNWKSVNAKTVAIYEEALALSVKK
jgi:glycosyltransferase involved in cell wall biosynthesis